MIAKLTLTLALAITALAQDTGGNRHQRRIEYDVGQEYGGDADNPHPVSIVVNANVAAGASTAATDTNWNTTYFAFPSSSDKGYWVNSIENQVVWKPVSQSTYMKLENSNTSVFADTPDLGQNTAGGIGESTYTPQNLPVANNYMLVLYEVGTNKKIAQTDPFWIKANGTAKAPAVAAVVTTTSMAATSAATSSTPSHSAGNGASSLLQPVLAVGAAIVGALLAF